jgi:hypothetical protein
MPSEDPDVDGTAVQGSAVLSVEKQWRRIMLSVGSQQHNLENPSGPHLAPPPSPNKKMRQVVASIAAASIPAAWIVWLCKQFK